MSAEPGLSIGPVQMLMVGFGEDRLRVRSCPSSRDSRSTT